MARLLEAFHIFPPSYLISALSLTVGPSNYKWLTRSAARFVVVEGTHREQTVTQCNILKC
jgi:hypothetical protein